MSMNEEDEEKNVNQKMRKKL